MKTVFLHGLGQTPADWNAITRQFPASEVDCPDLFSLAHDSLCYPELLTALEVRYAAESEPLRLCGLSLGGMLALDYAIRHPGRVDSLVLIGVQDKVPSLLVDLQNFLFRWMPESRFAEMGLSKRAMLQLTCSMRDLDFTERLETLCCPVKIVCGEKDYANRSAANRFTRLLPQAELYLIPSAGHEVNRSAPESIVELLH